VEESGKFYSGFESPIGCIQNFLIRPSTPRVDKIPTLGGDCDFPAISNRALVEESGKIEEGDSGSAEEGGGEGIWWSVWVAAGADGCFGA
jgi:hypothetical protein